MKRRCRRDIFYISRGITVDARWLGKDGFIHFLEDMGERPPDTTLDRIDNDKGYSKENCRWADRKTQQENQKRTKWIIYENVRYTTRELERKLELPHGFLQKYVIKRGMSLEEAIELKPYDVVRKKITYEGQTRTLSDWCRHYKISENTARARLKTNWPLRLVFSSKRYNGRAIKGYKKYPPIRCGIRYKHFKSTSGQKTFW